jgi:hypothetical protein
VQAETALPQRDYAPDYSAGTVGASAREEYSASPAASLFQQTNMEAERDLDVPAFLRRSQF